MRTAKFFGVAALMLLGCEIALAQLPANPATGAARGVPGRTAADNYQRFCAACHGPGGRPTMPDVPVLSFNQSLLTQTDMQLLTKLKTGTPPKKPPFMGILSDRELLDLIAYIRTFR